MWLSQHTHKLLRRRAGAISQAHRRGRPVAALMIDIDHFKSTNEDQVRHAAVRIHRMVARLDPGAAIPAITVSIGAAIAHDAGAATRDSLLERADRALYHAKGTGRNTTHILTD